MLAISPEDIAARLRTDNPWWSPGFEPVGPPYDLPRRAYAPALRSLIEAPVRRAVILLGARRVGKTTLLRQLIGEFAAERRFAAILYVSVDTPTYTGLSLARLLDVFERECPHDPAAPRLVVFDEIQYLRDWERHLKDLVDTCPTTRFVVSGSAGAALRRKSDESGAGRFTDFELPPLTFAEFLDLSRTGEALIETLPGPPAPRSFGTRDIEALCRQFVAYLNYGGYPEAVVDESVRRDLSQFIGRDIVDKVLLRDLPSLYGIQDIQELNRLFTMLAYNTGQEVSLEKLSQGSGVAKNTIQRYLDYLEAAFLIVRLRRIDESARRFTRQRSFKVYLTNPSMRAALFGPVTEDHPAMGALAETAAIGQWLHSAEFRHLHYARWPDGEVDLVRLDAASQRPLWAYDVKWSDRHATRTEELGSLVAFARKNGLRVVGASTRTVQRTMREGDVEIRLFPLPLHAYTVGRMTASEPTLLERWAPG